ncbi:MAG: hypothetical protein KGL39_08605 [Patescibacteria group bacterium]|nr:hypothetical protein [Patescibacteria group bacterium]
MTNQPLGLVRFKVKSELRKATDTTNTVDDPVINQLIESEQQALADSFDWAFLQQRWDVYVNPGQRFVPFPTTYAPQGGSVSATGTIDFNRPFVVQTKWNSVWIPVIYGINEIDEFNYLDSDQAQQLDPVQRWQRSDTGQFEVWPLPATKAQIRFKQSRALTSLQTGSSVPPVWNDAALLDLDDLLVVYRVAMGFAATEKKGNFPVLAQKFQERLRALLGQNPVRTEVTIIGGGQPMGRKQLKLVPLVMVAGGH